MDESRILSEAYKGFFKSIELGPYVDISHLGRWRLSSAKAGYSLEQLLERDPDTFWQSEGDLPHFIEIQFSKLVEVSMIGLYTDSSMDESYTPRMIHTYAGFGRYNLARVNHVELQESVGWSCIMLDDQGPQHNRPLQCTFIRIEISKNFQNGRDSHLRGLQIVGPSPQTSEKSVLDVAFRRL